MLIQIKLPNFTSPIFLTIKYWLNSIRYLVKPVRCEKCNARLVAYTWRTYSSRFNVTNMNGHRLCNSCQIDMLELEETLADHMFVDMVSNKCDACGLNKLSKRFYKTDEVSLHFMQNVWLGQHICKDCVIDCLKNGDIRTSKLKYDGERYVDVGLYDLFIHGQKVKLFHIFK